MVGIFRFHPTNQAPADVIVPAFYVIGPTHLRYRSAPTYTTVRSLARRVGPYINYVMVMESDAAVERFIGPSFVGGFRSTKDTSNGRLAVE